MLGNIVYTPAAAVATSLTIGTTPITGGTAGAVLFESTLNKVSENAGLNYTAGGVLTITSITQQLKVAFNAGNRLDLTVGSTGDAAFALTGTTPKFQFNSTTASSLQLLSSGELGLGVVPTATNYRFEIFGGGIYGTLSLGKTNSQGLDFKMSSTVAEISSNYYGTGSATGSIHITTYGGAGTLKGLTIESTGKVSIVSTSEQFRVGYDSTHFASFTTNSTGALTITLTGTALSTFFTDKVVLGNTITLAPYSFATLPAAPLAGQKAYIIDALAPAYLAPAVGGGLIFCPVFYNGINWVTC